MKPIEASKIGQASEPGEYDDGMQALLQIIWGDGFFVAGRSRGSCAPARGERHRRLRYLNLAQRELQAMEGRLNPVIVQRIGAERARHFVDNWRQLVVVLKRGELRPGHLKAVKPVGPERSGPV